MSGRYRWRQALIEFSATLQRTCEVSDKEYLESYKTKAPQTIAGLLLCPELQTLFLITVFDVIRQQPPVAPRRITFTKGVTSPKDPSGFIKTLLEITQSDFN